MLYLALAELGVIILTIFASAHLARSQSRAHARREDLLLNQVLHAAGRPWQPAPADTQPKEQIDWDELLPTMQYSRFTASPEQEP
jgi:hypothetical protein